MNDFLNEVSLNVLKEMQMLSNLFDSIHLLPDVPKTRTLQELQERQEESKEDDRVKKTFFNQFVKYLKLEQKTRDVPSDKSKDLLGEVCNCTVLY